MQTQQFSAAVRIFIVEDHECAEMGIRWALAKEPRLKVVGAAKNGLEAIEKINLAKPDMTLVDLGLPILDGVSLTKILRSNDRLLKIIWMTCHHPAQFLHDYHDLEVNGFIDKACDSIQLRRLICAVYNGQQVFWTPPLRASAYSREDNTFRGSMELSPRQLEVLALVAKGFPTKQIAPLLHLSPRTVEEYRENICRKLSLSNVAEMTAYAIHSGLIR